MVLKQPEHLQEATFMVIQYTYAVLTMLPCPLWFMNRHASTAFLTVVFTWSIYNGATYYIDVFGTRFQKELEAMKAEIMKWQNSPDHAPLSPSLIPRQDGSVVGKPHSAPEPTDQLSSANDAEPEKEAQDEPSQSKNSSVDDIPLLDETQATSSSTGVDEGQTDGARERKAGAASCS